MRVNFYATLRPIVGGKTVDFPIEEGITVAQLVNTIVTTYPPMREQLLNEQGELYPHVHVFVNGRDAPALDAGMQTLLTQKDLLDVFPAVAGG
jgi:molybdopterin synthase sulfur carrier subunit